MGSRKLATKRAIRELGDHSPFRWSLPFYPPNTLGMPVSALTGILAADVPRGTWGTPQLKEREGR